MSPLRQTSRPRHHDVNRCVGAAPASPMRLIGVAVRQTSGDGKRLALGTSPCYPIIDALPENASEEL
jgi:hypothetical protein